MNRPSLSLCDSDQYELDLFPGVPWSGRSPRGLTRAGKGLFLRPEPPSHEVDVDPLQLELWSEAVRPRKSKEPPIQRTGASLLLPLKEPKRFPFGIASRTLEWGLD